MVDRAELSDFEICNEYNIDNTGLVCKFSLCNLTAHFIGSVILSKLLA